MKIKHKINHGWCPSIDLVIDDRYEAEITRSMATAERAWRSAQRAAERAERVFAKRPEPSTRRLREEAVALVEARLRELRELQSMMRRNLVPGRKFSGTGSVHNPLPKPDLLPGDGAR